MCRHKMATCHVYIVNPEENSYTTKYINIYKFQLKCTKSNNLNDEVYTFKPWELEVVRGGLKTAHSGS